MRLPLGVSLVVVVAACGGSGRSVKGPTFTAGAAVRISDGQQIFDALNTTTCVKWPSPDVKKRAGRDGWRGFHPDTGNEGKVLASLGHCDGKTQVVLVEIGSYVVPVTSKGVELATADAAPAPGGEIGSSPEYLEAYGGVGYGADPYGYGGYGYGGYYGTGSAGFNVGDTVSIVNNGEVYPDINTFDCLVWPSDDAKTRGGSGYWGSYSPQNGEVGVIIGISPHCNSSVEVLILDVNGNIVPIGSLGVAIY